MLSSKVKALFSRPDAGVRIAAFLAYGLGLVLLLLAFLVRPTRELRMVHTLQRGLLRGEVGPSLPKLDRNDAMANAAVLNAALADVPHPGIGSGIGPDGSRCNARARSFAVYLEGRLSRVRFGSRTVCQLQRLKEISKAQPGFAPRGLAEVAAFILGRRLPGGDDVDVTRVVVPPFRFSGDSLTFLSADLGPLQAGERFIGTYHTHPEDDITQGVLSEMDLDFMRDGFVDFAGAVGRLARPPVAAAEPGQGHGAPPADDVDWLFDIVDPRNGDWNVYGHDARRLAALRDRCARETPCPLNELRLAGSPYNLFARVYEERPDEPDE